MLLIARCNDKRTIDAIIRGDHGSDVYAAEQWIREIASLSGVSPVMWTVGRGGPGSVWCDSPGDAAAMAGHPLKVRL